MFEKIVLRRSQAGTALTPGEIAEALLFYQNVHLVIDTGAIDSISRTLGMGEFLALVRRKRLTAVYTGGEMLIAHTSPEAIPRHGFATALMGDKSDRPQRKGRRGHLELALERSGHSRGDAVRLAGQFLDLIPTRSYSGDYFAAGGILKSAIADLRNNAYVLEAVRKILRHQVGFEDFADKLNAEIIHLTDGGMVMRSSINFPLGNSRRKQIDPSLENFTEAHLLVALLEANADVNIASLYGGDFYTSSISSDIVQVRFSELLRRTEISQSQLQEFREVALADYPTIREVINSNERSFKDFEKVLDQSTKFRESVHRMGPDSNLVEVAFPRFSRHHG